MAFSYKNHKIKGRHQVKFNAYIKYVKYFLLFILIVYVCMMAISLEAHGHAADVPLPTMQDLIPVTINHFDYKYSYELFHSPNNAEEAMQEQWETSHFPLMNDYTGDFSPDAHIMTNSSPKKCPVTVVFVDANFPNRKSGDPSFFELESIATFLPNACIIIQTSRCSFHNALPVAEEMNLSLEHSIYLRMVTMVEEETHEMMERGQVRVTFLNHEKYNLDACDDFSSFSSRALLNVNYWRDEFHEKDSNSVIIVRKGAVLCHRLDVEKYIEYAFVAAPLTSRNEKIFGGSDYCNALKTLWKTSVVNSSIPSSSSLLDEKNAMANILQSCLEGVGPMPINESFSMFHREKVLEAIQTCPHEQYSGLEMNQLSQQNRSCVWHQGIDSSLYFSTILAVMGARLPTGVVASLFSTNEIWPEQALEMYGGPFFNYKRQLLASKYNCIYKGANVKTRTGREVKRTVPISLHVPLDTTNGDEFQKRELLSHDVVEQCPFIKYVL
mmetsp:Transcript_8231/g.15505  ORF Transcript_8231/g.15505 Transcript_8231/m.15505 type:complete len:497 (-) Transcript_8231:8-1498(-)